MHTILKFTKDQAKNMIFLSDLHLNHQREFIWKTRGFTSEIKHREHIFENLSKNITKDTIIFNLGDVCFGDANMEIFDRLLEATKEAKSHYILFGNHNSGVKQAYQKAIEGYFGYFKNIEVYPLQGAVNSIFCGREMTIRVGKKEIHLSHFPKRIWDHVGYGSWSLSGHSHSNDDERNVDYPIGKALDVGVENALDFSDQNVFFTYENIEDIMSNKSIHAVDHHDNTV